MYCLDFSWIRVYAGTAVHIAKEHNAISFDVAFLWVEHNTSLLCSCHQCIGFCRGLLDLFQQLQCRQLLK